MKCQDFEKEYLLDDGNLSAEARAHAQICPSCRELMQIMNLLSTAARSPSPELDRKTVAAALCCMHSQKTSRWPARIQTALYAAAAALILLFSVISLQKPTSPETQALTLTAESSQPDISLQASSEPLSDLDALCYLNRKETSSELDKLELQLSLYANLL